jgi:hypothetical protein
MSMRGMTPEKARELSAALDVVGGALAIQGTMIYNILVTWEGDTGELGQFTPKSTWMSDQAADINDRLGILESDPESTLVFAGLGGVLETWERVRESDAYERYTETREDVSSGLKALSIPSAIEAGLQLYQRWNQGQNVAAARAVLELHEWWGDAGRIRNARTQLLGELLESQRIRNLYRQPWRWQQSVANIAQRLRIPGASRLLNPPGVGLLARVALPLNVATGLWEMVNPTHDGAQGWVDRGMGGLQATGAVAVMGGASMATALGASATVAAAVPVAGWAVLGVTGAYFLGSWAWDEWGDEITEGLSTAWDATTDFVGDAWDDTTEAVGDAWDSAGDFVSDLTPW